MTTNRYIDLVKQNLAPPFPKKLWQRNYHDHIIRNEKSLGEIRKYVAENALGWEKDELFVKN